MVRLQVYVPDEVAAQMDAARGLATRSTWVKDAIVRQLEGAPAPVLPSAKNAPKRRLPKLRGSGGARV